MNSEGLLDVQVDGHDDDAEDAGDRHGGADEVGSDVETGVRPVGLAEPQTEYRRHVVKDRGGGAAADVHQAQQQERTQDGT